MTLTLIAAMAQNRVIGKDNDLIWHLPKDMRHFKQSTTGHHVIMGRKTYESMMKPLPNRTNIIITRNKDYTAEGCLVVNSLEEALEHIKGDDQPYIIGGAEIYEMALPLADMIKLTIVQHEFEGDAHFPEIDKTQWQEVSRDHHDPDEKNKYPMDFITYKKV